MCERHVSDCRHKSRERISTHRGHDVGWLGEHWSLLDSPPWYASDVASWLGWKDPERVVFDADS